MSNSSLPFLQDQFNRYSLPIILIYGNIGNIFIVILFHKRRLRSCSIYLIWSAILNNAFITFNIPITLYTIQNGDPTIRSLAFCKIRFYLYHTWGQIARYLFVFACIDRCILISHYTRIRMINRLPVTKTLTKIIFIFWHIFPIHILILITITNGRCGPIGTYYIIYYIYLLVFVCLIPSISMIICAVLTFRNMHWLHRRIQPIDNTIDNNRSYLRIHRRDRELLLMVFAEIVIYTITTFVYPFTIIEISVTTYLGIDKSLLYRQIENFISNLGTIFIYLNSAAPFYTYLVVSKPFRLEFKRFLLKWMRQATARVIIIISRRTTQVEQ